MKIFLGIDPDLHDTAVAFLEVPEGGKPSITAYTLSIPKTVKGSDAVVQMAWMLAFNFQNRPPADVIVVESQQLVAGHKARTSDIIALAQVAGAAVAASSIKNNKGPVCELVSPGEWKGQVPKEIHQARICKKLGWTFESRAGYQTVTSTNHQDSRAILLGNVLKASDWKHVLDAIGLAMWGLKETNPNEHARLFSPGG